MKNRMTLMEILQHPWIAEKNGLKKLRQEANKEEVFKLHTMAEPLSSKNYEVNPLPTTETKEEKNGK